MWRASASRKRQKSRRRARLLPRLLAERVGAADLGGEVGRHAHGLLVVAARPATSRDVVGVGVLAGGPRLERVEQPAELGVGQLVVARSRSSVPSWSARAAAPPGGIIVFWSQNSSACDAAEVGELGHPLAGARPARRARRSPARRARRRRRAARRGRRACSARRGSCSVSSRGVPPSAMLSATSRAASSSSAWPGRRRGRFERAAGAVRVLDGLRRLRLGLAAPAPRAPPPRARAPPPAGRARRRRARAPQLRGQAAAPPRAGGPSARPARRASRRAARAARGRRSRRGATCSRASSPGLGAQLRRRVVSAASRIRCTCSDGRRRDGGRRGRAQRPRSRRRRGAGASSTAPGS